MPERLSCIMSRDPGARCRLSPYAVLMSTSPMYRLPTMGPLGPCALAPARTSRSHIQRSIFNVHSSNFQTSGGHARSRADHPDSAQSQFSTVTQISPGVQVDVRILQGLARTFERGRSISPVGPWLRILCRNRRRAGFCGCSASRRLRWRLRQAQGLARDTRTEEGRASRGRLSTYAG